MQVDLNFSKQINVSSGKFFYVTSARYSWWFDEGKFVVKDLSNGQIYESDFPLIQHQRIMVQDGTTTIFPSQLFQIQVLQGNMYLMNLNQLCRLQLFNAALQLQVIAQLFDLNTNNSENKLLAFGDKLLVCDGHEVFELVNNKLTSTGILGCEVFGNNSTLIVRNEDQLLKFSNDLKQQNNVCQLESDYKAVCALNNSIIFENNDFLLKIDLINGYQVEKHSKTKLGAKFNVSWRDNFEIMEAFDQYDNVTSNHEPFKLLLGEGFENVQNTYLIIESDFVAQLTKIMSKQVKELDNTSTKKRQTEVVFCTVDYYDSNQSKFCKLETKKLTLQFIEQRFYLLNNATRQIISTKFQFNQINFQIELINEQIVVSDSTSLYKLKVGNGKLCLKEICEIYDPSSSHRMLNYKNSLFVISNNQVYQVRSSELIITGITGEALYGDYQNFIVKTDNSLCLYNSAFKNLKCLIEANKMLQVISCQDGLLIVEVEDQIYFFDLTKHSELLLQFDKCEYENLPQDSWLNNDRVIDVNAITGIQLNILQIILKEEHNSLIEQYYQYARNLIKNAPTFESSVFELVDNQNLGDYFNVAKPQGSKLLCFTPVDDNTQAVHQYFRTSFKFISIWFSERKLFVQFNDSLRVLSTEFPFVPHQMLFKNDDQVVVYSGHLYQSQISSNGIYLLLFNMLYQLDMRENRLELEKIVEVPNSSLVTSYLKMLIYKDTVYVCSNDIVYYLCENNQLVKTGISGQYLLGDYDNFIVLDKGVLKQYDEQLNLMKSSAFMKKVRAMFCEGGLLCLELEEGGVELGFLFDLAKQAKFLTQFKLKDIPKVRQSNYCNIQQFYEYGFRSMADSVLSQLLEPAIHAEFIKRRSAYFSYMQMLNPQHSVEQKLILSVMKQLDEPQLLKLSSLFCSNKFSMFNAQLTATLYNDIERKMRQQIKQAEDRLSLKIESNMDQIFKALNVFKK